MIDTDWRELRERIVLWEDDSALVVNKPPGLSVMGERHDTDLVTIAASAGEKLWWVHRIDKVTSGAVLLAKTRSAHATLTRQFAKRTVDKAYLAICRPGDMPGSGAIDLPLFTASSGRIRVAAERQNIKHDSLQGTWYVEADDLLPRKSYPSRTEYEKLWDNTETTVVLAIPVTGRRHQIRVHLAWTGHAILGDPLFTKKTDPVMPRTYLHSLRVGFFAAGRPTSWVEVNAPPLMDFWLPVNSAFDDAGAAGLLQAAENILKVREPG